MLQIEKKIRHDKLQHNKEYAHTISCRHKGVIDLIYSSPRTQNLVGPRGAITQMKKEKKTQTWSCRHNHLTTRKLENTMLQIEEQKVIIWRRIKHARQQCNKKQSLNNKLQTQRSCRHNHLNTRKLENKMLQIGKEKDMQDKMIRVVTLAFTTCTKDA